MTFDDFSKRSYILKEKAIKTDFILFFFAKNKVPKTNQSTTLENLVCLVLNSILFFSMVLTNMYGYSKLMFCESAITNVYVCSMGLLQ